MILCPVSHITTLKPSRVTIKKTKHQKHFALWELWDKPKIRGSPWLILFPHIVNPWLLPINRDGGVVKNEPANVGDTVQSQGQEDPLEREVANCSSIPAGEFHGQRKLEGCSPRGSKELDTTACARVHAHTHPPPSNQSVAFASLLLID